MSHAYNIGKKIACKVGEQNIAGLFKEIDQDGRLVVELETGDVYKMSSAEVFF
jgi:biotin-(acetyl-CoA carboxylase) ligase